MAKLKKLLKDMEQRLAILQEESNKKWRNEVIEARISELTSSIVAIQQILISEINEQDNG